MKDINIGIIGVGSMGRLHLKNLVAINGCKIIAICDNCQESLNKACEIVNRKIKQFNNYGKLLDLKEIDAVIIVTPNYTHREITVAALKAGKHVLCEKPMATTVKDCDDIIEASKNVSKVLQIGLELRYTTMYLRIASFVSHGFIGRVQMMWYKEFRGPFGKKVNDWILKSKKSGGTLVEKACHYFDLFNWIVKAKPVKVVAFGGQNVEYRDKGSYAKRKDKWTKVEVIDNAWVIIEYENGVRTCLGLSLFAPFGKEFEFGVIGDKGKLEAFHFAQKINLWKKNKPRKKSYKIIVPSKIKSLSHMGGIYYELKSFLYSIRNNKKPIVSGEIGRDSVLVAIAAEKSIQEGRVIYIDEITRRKYL